MRFKPTIPTVRRISKSNIPQKSDTIVKEESRSTVAPLQRTYTSNRIRRQDVITPNITVTGPFSQGRSSTRSVKKEAAEGHIRLQDNSHTYPTGSDSQTRSRHIYGDIQLPIDLMNSPDTRLKSLISCVSPELRDADVINADSSSEANSKAQSSNDLGDLGKVDNGSLILIQMPSILPSFKSTGDESIIPSPSSPVREKYENIIEISEINESETMYLGQSKQKSKAPPKQLDKGKSKAKEENKKKGKENRRTSISSKANDVADDRSKRKMSITSVTTLSKEDMEHEIIPPRRRPEIDISHLPDGQFGSLLVYKSGKVKLRIGETMMDLESGILANCLEDLVIVEANDKPIACQLGSVQHKIVASPNLHELLKLQD
ncbi:RNA polymerase III RPC4-domain-containing protein [Umbelopsis sp. PMI_123]|nr:RNA polymerase III RPC4-domain-containing protein [Umbelopsis sp. PMI_123]